MRICCITLGKGPTGAVNGYDPGHDWEGPSCSLGLFTWWNWELGKRMTNVGCLVTMICTLSCPLGVTVVFLCLIDTCKDGSGLFLAYLGW